MPFRSFGYERCKSVMTTPPNGGEQTSNRILRGIIEIDREGLPVPDLESPAKTWLISDSGPHELLAIDLVREVWGVSKDSVDVNTLVFLVRELDTEMEGVSCPASAAAILNKLRSLTADDEGGNV